jgi:cell division transport system permease protein
MRTLSLSMITPTVSSVTNRRGMLTIFAAVTCLACLIVLLAMSALRTSNQWSDTLRTSYTVELKPIEGADPQDQLKTAMIVLKNDPDMLDVTPMQKKEVESLMSPWLGNAPLDGLPLSQLVKVRIKPDHPQDTLERLSKSVTDIPGGSIESYHAALVEFETAAQNIKFASVSALLMLFVMCGAIIIIAIRASVVDNRHVIDLMHLMGAEDRLIRKVFQTVFNRWCYQGCAIGLGITLFILGVMALTASMNGMKELFLFSQLTPNFYNLLSLSAVPLSVIVMNMTTTQYSLRRILLDHRV